MANLTLKSFKMGVVSAKRVEKSNFYSRFAEYCHSAIDVFENSYFRQVHVQFVTDQNFLKIKVYRYSLTDIRGKYSLIKDRRPHSKSVFIIQNIFCRSETILNNSFDNIEDELDLINPRHLKRTLYTDMGSVGKNECRLRVRHASRYQSWKSSYDVLEHPREGL